MLRLASLLGVAAAVAVASSDHDALTPRHEAGRCAVRGHCGKLGFFGKALPCVDNGPAADPDEELRSALVDVCGDKWSEGPICCDAEQVDALKSSLSTANQMIQSCPACKENFYNLFCTFTCSPDQSLFVNVTQTAEKGGKTLVTELDHLVSDEYGAGLYDSCKDVKVGSTNSRAMAFIGGGAKEYQAMLKFLGDKKALGSPFQMNFPRRYPDPDMTPLRDMQAHPCNDEDERYRCVCVDCAEVCGKLPEVEQAGSCRVGVLPCLSFAAIFTYGMLALAGGGLVAGRVAWQRHRERRTQRRRLLQDSRPSDDEDEGDLVHNEAMLDRPQRYYRLNTWCDAAFRRLGLLAARFPAVTILASLTVAAVLSAGWVRFELERDPARLWVSPTSAAAREKAFFDANFGPFYRAEQAFLVNDTTGQPGPVLSHDTLVWWIGVEAEVAGLRGPSFGTALEDVCFNPLGAGCAVQSVTAYWNSDPAAVDPVRWRDQLRDCAASPVSCRPAFGQPIEPGMILGGWDDKDGGGGGDVTEATAMTITWVINNAAEDGDNGDGYRLSRAKDWEQALKTRLFSAQEEARARGLRLSFSTEISLEEELNKSTNTDAKIVAVSYAVMFAYVAVALGSSAAVPVRELVRNPALALVRSKVGLSVAAIGLVLLSISASVGLFSWAGVRATLIIAEVIPFIVLAVGVDNVFLMVHELDRVNISHPDEMVEERIGRTLGRMGPSILLSALTETACFGLGALVGMPAVRNFAIYATGAVVINALLQVTMFVSILSLDQIRVEDSRADCFPCVQVKSARVRLGGGGIGAIVIGSGGMAGTDGSALAHNHHHNQQQHLQQHQQHQHQHHSLPLEVPEESWLQQLIRKRYAPWLLGRSRVKVSVAAVFLGLFAAAVALLPGLRLGLDQRVAIPEGSYLIPYFDDVYAYLGTGPPVYFVTRDLNTTRRHEQRQACARFTTCNPRSLPNTLEGERKRPEVSYIGTPAAGWLDDFFLWLSPAADRCCVGPDGVTPCFEGRDPPWNATMYGMPEGEEFVYYLKRWLDSPTNEDCPLGGRAAYGSAVVVDEQRTTVAASHFRTMHTPLRGQDDFIAAYTAARRIAADVAAETGADVFPYSPFYIFFDQYLDIIPLTGTLLGAAVAAIFVIALVLLGSFRTALTVAATVTMTVVDVMGVMVLAGVSLNAVSLVNLIISVGIAVEFCAHVARAFTFPSRTVMERAPRLGFRGRDARAWTALVNVGASVFSGITMTKFAGVCVLAFTRSKIFDIYYFRVWLALVLSAAPHALVFLPVALSAVGGRGYVDPESEGGLEEDLASRRYRALVPEDSDSDEEGY